MGSAWLGLLGAVIGGLVSLIGTLITTRLQWRQERIRWGEQRERDLLQWKEQRDSDTEKWEAERRRDALAWERSRDDERVGWFREQKLKCYLEILDHLLAASELAASATPVNEGERRRYTRDDEMAIVRELRKGYRWTKSASAVCGKSVTEQLGKLSGDLYFTMQVVSYEGIGPGGMVRRPEGEALKKWILSETIDKMSLQISEILRADLGST